MGGHFTQHSVPTSDGVLAHAVRRVMLRTSAGLLRPVWGLCYGLSARLVAAYLRGRRPGCAVYAVGSLGGPDVVYGVSDIDLVVVAPRASGRPGQTREAAVARRQLLHRALPLQQLLSVDVFESADLEWAMMRCPSLDKGPRALLVSPRSAAVADSQPPALALRAGLGLPASSWRLLAGSDRLPHPSPRHDHQPEVAAWLELQHWWRHAFSACLNPAGPRAPYLCVKLVAEPARIYIWLTRRQWASSRREALEWGLEALPDERDTFERALALLEELRHSPKPPLAEMLAALRRLSTRIGQQLAVDLQSAGTTDVRLDWRGEKRLPTLGSHDRLRAALGTARRLLPLADWRALVWPSRIDEFFELVSGDPADPLTLAATARAARAGRYRALHADSLLVLPATTGGRAKLRAVQCRFSDPVSFALIEGASTARFPNVTGWSIQDIAGRAVAEHRAWLAQSAGIVSRDGLAKLLGCARAALLLESVEQGSPELPADMAATAVSLGDRHPGAAPAAEEAYHTLTANSSQGVPARTAASLRERVLQLPAYRQPRGPVPMAI